MYHLTCPSCQDVTDSPFVRSGAVVRCTACSNKYRIKSAHFERRIHTGPRTLDESDSILRSDSVDIDPDEVAPVSIDDDGNVVGLSGLSELMRWSDTQDSSQVTAPPGSGKTKKRKPKREADAPLPEAKPAPKAAEPKATESIPGSGRARAQALKRKKRNKMYAVLGGAGALLILFVILIVVLLPDKEDPFAGPAEDGDNQEGPTPGVVDNEPAPPNNPDPDPWPDRGTEPGPSDPQTPDEVMVFSKSFKPSPNPRDNFVAPWLVPKNGPPPTDAPTVLTPAKSLSHEGWYVMNPPRGAADATGVSDVEMGQMTASPIGDARTLLAGSVSNNSARALMRGELHIMLLDSTGNVFAETYTPLAMIEPNSKQAIAMEIPTRYWKRSRGVRAGVQVSSWADQITPVPGVRLAPAGHGQSSALRVSALHQGNKPLRSMIMMLRGTDSNGNAVASFLIEEENLYVAKGHWLDLVVATPLPEGRQVAKWSAVLQSK